MRLKRNFMPRREFPVTPRRGRNLVRNLIAGCMGALVGGFGAAFFGAGALAWWVAMAAGFAVGVASVSGIKPPVLWQSRLPGHGRRGSP